MQVPDSAVDRFEERMAFAVEVSSSGSTPLASGL